MNEDTSPAPGPRISTGPDGLDLTLTRSFRASALDVWASISESDRLGRWFCTFDGTPTAGDFVEITLIAEEGAPTSRVQVIECDPPRLLRVRADDASGTWDLSAVVTEEADRTMLSLTHHGVDPDALPSFGAGWEFYLDCLVASREGASMPDFDDYWPRLQASFERLQSAQF